MDKNNIFAIHLTDMKTAHPSTKRRTIYISEQNWQRAVETARDLNLSTSQFISRLVVETSPLIRRDFLLGLNRLVSTPLHNTPNK